MRIMFSDKFVCCATGQEPDDKTVDGMMSEAPGPLNFTMFLTLFGEKLNGYLITLNCVWLINHML